MVHPRQARSHGAQGIEPPDDIKPLWDLTDKWKSSLPGSDDYIKLGQQLVQVPGIADVVTFGGYLKEVHVEVDPDLRSVVHQFDLGDLADLYTGRANELPGP